MKEISVQELKKKIDDKVDFQLIDIREPHEYEISNLGAELIPMSSIIDELDRIRKDVDVVLHCRTGSRSGQLCTLLEARFGFTNLYNLAGGINAYAKEIDNSLTIY